MTLDDNQLAAATAVMRGNVTIREGESYTTANLGRWNSESDVTLKQDVCRVCSITQEQAEQVCWSYPAKSSESTKSGANGMSIDVVGVLL
jgi:hypothetical protein